MMKLKNMLVIAGSGRNVGKTELTCRLLEKISRKVPVVTLKISGINPGNNLHHGNHDMPPDKYRLLEETNRDGVKDSSKMLLAGAARSFYLRTREEFLHEAIEHFFREVDRQSVIICESASIRKLLEPGLFVIVKGNSGEPSKKRLDDVLHLADLVIVSDGRRFIPGPEVVDLSDHGWCLGNDAT